MLESIINFLVDLVADWGYIGIFLLMALESSFFPFPSEVVMIPAGYLVFKGDMNMFLAFLSGASGSLFGALFNYYLCYFFGRPFIEKYGKFVGITEEKMRNLKHFLKNTARYRLLIAAYFLEFVSTSAYLLDLLK